MKKANLIISAVMIIIAVAIIAIASTYPRAAAYGTGAPGPGLWPICVSAVIIAMSLILAAKTIFSKKEEKDIVLIDVNHIRVYFSMAVLIVYFVLLKPIGFLLPTFIMVTFFIYWFSKKNDEAFVAKKAKSKFGKIFYEVMNIKDGVIQSRPLWLCAVISIITTFVVYFAFKVGLSVPMNFGLLYI